MTEMLLAIFLGIVEGITEWLPISSTGHMILFNRFLGSDEGFLSTDVFLYVIQLGAIMAIVTLYFKKLNPFSPSKSKEEKSRLLNSSKHSPASEMTLQFVGFVVSSSLK